MMLVKKGATKRCCYGVCKSDTRSRTFQDNQYYFINFPKPCLDYRKKVIKCSSKVHIKTCPKCRKCALWVKKCGRSDRGFRSINDVTKDTYICSLHFYGESGPTERYPNPLSYWELEYINKLHKKEVKVRTSLLEKYNKSNEKEPTGSLVNKSSNVDTVEKTLMVEEEVNIIINNNINIVKKVLLEKGAFKKITRTIKIQYNLVDTYNAIT